MIEDETKSHYMFEVKGGEAEARRLWGNKVSIGKLGIVSVPGEKYRLV